jgi:hypothetical protein
VCHIIPIARRPSAAASDGTADGSSVVASRCRQGALVSRRVMCAVISCFILYVPTVTITRPLITVFPSFIPRTCPFEFAVPVLVVFLFPTCPMIDSMPFFLVCIIITIRLKNSSIGVTIRFTNFPNKAWALHTHAGGCIANHGGARFQIFLVRRRDL